MRRREFITLLGGAAVAWPAAPRAERAPLPVIGYLSARTAEDSGEVLAEFRRGLAETGFVEGQNVTIEYRWLAGRYDLLPEFIGDLVRRRVSVIAIPSGSSSALAAKAATRTIPIVFNIGSDPVAIGLVASLSHPGQNATGIGMLQTAVAAKRVELLRELVPTAGSIALLVNPANPAFANPEAKQVQEAALVLGLKLLVLNASTPSEIDAAFATMVQQQIGALVVGGEAFYISRTAQFVTLAARHAMPAIYAWLEQAAAGALMCYGAPVANTQRSLGIYTGRILKGEKPGDLPVQQVTKLQLIINLTTAKALGLEIPPTLLARADEVIEWYEGRGRVQNETSRRIFLHLAAVAPALLAVPQIAWAQSYPSRPITMIVPVMSGIGRWLILLSPIAVLGLVTLSGATSDDLLAARAGMNSSRARDDATLIPNLGDDCPAARLGLPFSVPRFLQRAFIVVESELTQGNIC